MTDRTLRNAALAAPWVAAALLVAGCASTPADTPAKPVAPAVEVAVQPAPAPAPEIPPPAIAKPQAQKLALEAVDQLQNGDEAGARVSLDRALQLDPANDLAKKLSEQIRADAQKELGSVFFRYTVQKDDTLSKLAQQYLGDRYRFYVLAKYNDLANPSRLAAGQVIKIPGKAPVAQASPAPTPAPVAAPAEPVPAAKPVETSVQPRDDVADALAKAAEVEKSGTPEAAYAAYAAVAQRYPSNPEVARRRDAAKAAYLRSLDREASTAFQRQNLDLAIAKWDKVIELDPTNQKARLERERALDLKKKVETKFGNTAK